MRKLILYLVLINLAYFALVVAIYAFGYEYDKANQLYPEIKRLSYDLDIEVYGERWVRFLQIMAPMGLLIDLVIVAIWYLKRAARSESLELEQRTVLSPEESKNTV